MSVYSSQSQTVFQKKRVGLEKAAIVFSKRAALVVDTTTFASSARRDLRTFFFDTQDTLVIPRFVIIKSVQVSSLTLSSSDLLYLAVKKT